MRRYIITLDVSDHHANIVNFESADALKTSSSISSGALADHSSLSEISDNCCLPQKSSGTFLRASHSEEPSSTSSSSSGLTVNQTTSAPMFIRPPDHCLCCSVLQSLKIECSCGKRNIFYVRDGPAQKEARETKASDDMDLTDPVLDRLQPEQTERVEKEGENPEADVPPVAQLSASKLDGSQPDKWSLPAREHLFCIPEKLGPKERPPEVPPNYEEDSDSIFFHLVWTMKALEALQDSRSPPEGVVRVFYDQTLGVPEWPPCVLDFTKNYCDNELRLMRSEFMRWRQEVMREFENTRENRDVIVVSDDDTSEVEDTRPESPRQDVDVQQEEPTTSKLPRTDFCERLVYAKIDQWYHPGVVHCSIEQWDEMKGSLKVKFYDGDVHMMSPDKVFLFERLPSGVNIQLQTALDEYEDVVYMSHAASKHSSRLPSAILTIDDERSRIPFDKTAISPKDATHIRSILKHEFWPSKAQENSTKITADAILETKRMRKQGAIDIPLTSHVKPSVSSHKLPRKKRKVAVREEISIEVTQEKRFLCCIKNCKKTFSRFHDAKRHVRNIHGKKFLNVSMKKQPSKERTRLPSSDDQLPRKKRKVAVREEISTEVTQEKVPPPKKKKVAVSEETTDDTTDVAKEKQENTKFSCYVAGCHSCYTYEYDVRRHVKKCHGDKFLRKSARDMMKASKKACVAPNPQVLQEKSKTVPASSSTVTFANPSTSGLRLPTSGSDTDFAFSPVRSWNQFVDGHGLSRERLKFDTDVKSYVGIKGRKKIDMNTKNEVFKGHWIVFTSSSIDKKPAVRKRTNLDSESDSTDVENYYATPVKFDLAALRRAVECGGGKAACNIMDVPKDARESKESYRVILVSDHPCRTPNYLYGVASGFTIVRHDTILECFSKGITLRSALNSGSAILLPPGWDDIRMTWATPRTSHDWPFKRDLMYVALSCGADGNQFWSSVIRQLGGRPLDWFYPRQHLGDQVLAIIVDENLEEAKREVTRRHSIPLVTTAWLIQAIITGKMPSFDDMSYRLIF